MLMVGGVLGAYQIDLLVICDVLKAVDPLGSQEAARYKLAEKELKFAREFEM